MTTVQAERLKEAEERVGKFLASAAPLERLIMFKLLRLDMPYQPTTFDQLEHAINREIKKVS